MMPRAYNEYPSEYAELFMRFRRDGFAVIEDCTPSAAHSMRRDLSRYRTAVRTAARDDASDTYLRDLYEAARDMSITVEAQDEHIRPEGKHRASPNGLLRVALRLNPLVAAMRQRGTT